MIELTRTNDPVLLSWLSAHLNGAGIEHVVLDAHTSVLEGSIGAIQRRVMVLAEDGQAAREVLFGRPQISSDQISSDVEEESSSVTGVPVVSPTSG